MKTATKMFPKKWFQPPALERQQWRACTVVLNGVKLTAIGYMDNKLSGLLGRVLEARPLRARVITQMWMAS